VHSRPPSLLVAGTLIGVGTTGKGSVVGEIESQGA
jgi:hypothetical protein